MCIRDREAEMIEMVKRMMEENCKKIESLMKKRTEELGQIIDDGYKRMREIIRGELRNDNNSEAEEVPEDKNMEQVSPKPEDNEERRTQIIKKTEEKKMKVRGIICPKKTRITKELIEMNRSGLINMINFPIIDRREGIYMKAVSYTHLDVYKRQVCV